jgi:hypothetical protein
VKRAGETRKTAFVVPLDAVKQPNVAQKTDAPAPAPSASGPSSWSELRASLARLQIRLIDAQAYLQRGLSFAPMIETRPELEEAVAKWIGGDRSSMKATIAALAGDGPRALATLVELAEQQLAAFPKGQDFSALKGALAKEIFAHLAEHPAADRRAAFHSSLAATRSLSIGLTRDALYPGLRMGLVGTNSFTNEPGFPVLVREAQLKGGAAIGVGGAIFDLGSMGAELIISVDANVHIREVIQLFTAILLAVDAKCEREGLDDRQRAGEVLSWLTRGPNAETTSALKKLELPPVLLASVDDHLGAFAQKLAGKTLEAHPIPVDLWCRGEDAPARVRHLTQLALEGRIVAVTADLADPALVERVESLLAVHHSRAQVIHLSNALDYIPDVGKTLNNLGGISRTENAQLTTSAGNVLRNSVYQAMPDHHYLVDTLGTLEKPKLHAAKEWLGETRNARFLSQMIWQTGPHIRQLLDWTRAAFGIEQEPKVSPQDPAEYRQILGELLAKSFREPKFARQRLETVLQDSGRWDAYRDALGGEATPIRLPIADSIEELGTVADRFDAEFWAIPGKKERFLQAHLGDIELPKDRLAEARSFEDLRELLQNLARS